MDRDEFLARTRSAVGEATLPPASGRHGPLVWTPADGDLTERFVANLEAVDGIAHRVAPAAAADTIIAVLAEHSATTALTWTEGATGVPGLFDALEGAGVHVGATEIPDDAEGRLEHQAGYDGIVAGITGADAGLAESGSIVLGSGPGRSRMASLIPIVHVAVLPATKLHASLSHYVAATPQAAVSVANLVVVTGPSRTGDIESHLNLGVHGPRHLHVVIVEGN